MILPTLADPSATPLQTSSTSPLKNAERRLEDRPRDGIATGSQGVGSSQADLSATFAAALVSGPAPLDSGLLPDVSFNNDVALSPEAREIIEGWPALSADLTAAGLESQNILQEIFAALMSGDPESALETFSTIQRVVERDSGPASATSGGGANETRESMKLAGEYQVAENQAAFDELRKAREEYYQKIKEMEAAQEAALAEYEAAREAARVSVTDVPFVPTPVEPYLSLEESGAGNSLNYTKRELWKRKEIRPVTDESIAAVKALAQSFAADAGNLGYLTDAQADFLAASLLCVPHVTGSGLNTYAHAQISGELVDAAIEGFKAAGADAASVELMAAQLAKVAWAGANAVCSNATWPGNGQEALFPHMRTLRSDHPQGFANFEHPVGELPDFAAAPTREHAREHQFVPSLGGARIDAEGLEPRGDGGYEASFTLTPSPDQPMKFPVNARVMGWGQSELYRFTVLEDGRLQADIVRERQVLIEKDHDGEWPAELKRAGQDTTYVWPEVDETRTFEPNPDGSFTFTVTVPPDKVPPEENEFYLGIRFGVDAFWNGAASHDQNSVRHTFER